MVMQWTSSAMTAFTLPLLVEYPLSDRLQPRFRYAWMKELPTRARSHRTGSKYWTFVPLPNGFRTVGRGSTTLVSKKFDRVPDQLLCSQFMALTGLQVKLACKVQCTCDQHYGESKGSVPLPIVRTTTELDLSSTETKDPGTIVDSTFDRALASIENDLLTAVRAAGAYLLQPACSPSANLIDQYLRVLNEKNGKDTWGHVICSRIGETWRTRNNNLTWLDDKIAQVSAVAAMFGGQELHLPIFGHALASDTKAEKELQNVALDCIARMEPFVIKPRHGANSKHIFLSPDPLNANVTEVMENLRAALVSRDASWCRECWQLSQVPKGALLQPMYAIAIPKRGPEGRAAPLELKVQVLFGKVVGASLNTHPHALWVMSDGTIQMWSPTEIRKRRIRSLHRSYGEKIPEGLLEQLGASLRRDWPFIRRSSEHICSSVGLDELRVDWLVGDKKWGSRIGELTYIGAGSRLPPPLSKRIAKAYVAGHLIQLGMLVLKTTCPQKGEKCDVKDRNGHIRKEPISLWA